MCTEHLTFFLLNACACVLFACFCHRYFNYQKKKKEKIKLEENYVISVEIYFVCMSS